MEINLKNKTITLIAKFLFTLACLVFAILSLYLILKPNKYTEETSATITRIDEILDVTNTYDGDNFAYEVYVEYTIDDVKYEDILLNSYDSSMKVGDVININYNPEKKEEIETVGKKNYLIVFSVLFFALSIYGIYSIIKTYKNEDISD